MNGKSLIKNLIKKFALDFNCYVLYDYKVKSFD